MGKRAMKSHVIVTIKTALKISTVIAVFILAVYLPASLIAKPFLDLLDYTEYAKWDKCNFTEETKSALERVKTEVCRSDIKRLACAIEKGNYFTSSLPIFCPKTEIDSYGCHMDNPDRILQGIWKEFPETNSIENCISYCFQFGFRLAGVEYGKECHCANRFVRETKVENKTDCEQFKCPGNQSEFCGGDWRIFIFSTGIEDTHVNIIKPDYNNSTSEDSDIRFLFLMTVSGRYSRQILRLLKLIYSPKHYYYIHVDQRDDYLYRQLLYLETETSNVRLKKNRWKPVWGGSTHLKLILDSIRDLFELYSDWKWNFLMNLSESHLPLLPLRDLELFLSANRQLNFAERVQVDRFEYFHKQGFDWTFYECDNHLWRLAKRQFPSGISIDGNSDWFVLNREFLHYATYSEDALVKGLKFYFQYSQSPAESFFQILLANSEFCHTFAGENLQIVSWISGIACELKYEIATDWGGCSPVAFDFDTVENLNYNQLRKDLRFFGRKFDSTTDLKAVDFVERKFINLTHSGKLRNNELFGHQSYKKFWFNDYHYLDKSPQPDPAKLTLLVNLLSIAVDQSIYKPAKVAKAMIRESHILMEGSQVFLLLKYELKTIDSTLEFESKYQYKDNQKKISNHPGILSAEVGTDWDIRTYNFRNYAKSFGKSSRLGVRIAANLHKDTNITAKLYDGENILRDTVSMIAKPEMDVLLLKPNVTNMTIKFGIWKVKILVNKKAVRLLKFPILPELKNTDLAALSNFHFCPIAADIVSKFYTLQDSCVVSGHINNISMTICKGSNWSSLSPDPKSDFKPFA